MEEFILGQENSTHLRFHGRKTNSDGFLTSYLISIKGKNLTATLPIENLPYGSHPSDFFKEISKVWPKHKEATSWGAIEGEYELSAKTDSLGHIAITAHLHHRDWCSSWNA